MMKHKPSGGLSAVLGALAGSAAGCAVFVIVGIYANILVGWVGGLVAFLALKGYDLAGGEKGSRRTVTVSAASCPMVAVASYLTVAVSAMSVFGYDLFTALVKSAEYIVAVEDVGKLFTQNLIFGIAFTALGVYVFGVRGSRNSG